MTYPLENLDPNRFQQLCQSLLVKSFPDLQCFPILQADGGRDAVLRSDGEDGKNTIVYQVKFTKNALKDSAPHKTIVSALKKELPKIKNLIRQGVTKYVLMTNVPGTGRLDSGSIDVVQQLLDQQLEIPAQCWWRDDIERKLDDAWNIKWLYPDVFRNQDLLRAIIERGLTEDAARRTNAIRAFVREQFESDTDVRFKQIDLQNKLLDLFVDVPIDNRMFSDAFDTNREDIRALLSIFSQYDSLPSQPESHLGAATLLLHPVTQKDISKIVLEGAPGQGKSTIVQYVCQVHRWRLLNNGSVNQQMDREHQNTPIRLPFKIDCRDFAGWIRGINPFSLEGQNQIQVGYPTLEAFLASQIEYNSGGANFDVSDLHAVLNLSEILIVFDGLDEVANITQRKNVVEEITKGIRRIQELSLSLQTVVTSRPTVFAHSPRLSTSNFLYLQLGSIDSPLIKNYADKWIIARQLKQRDSMEVKKILELKLDQPHLRELARNPMQLTILLSLIHIRGTSLPDKRTALYDNYINLFFDREAEKSEIVREHRELLIDIHRYLAWVLHSETQTRQTGGRIESLRLKELVENYLQKSGHDIGLVDKLFSGMVERVVALVSRIEGTYEFEVQPMREYFVARYLYDTAPYSPAEDVKPGTLPERFDALTRDSFWQNVTRFYAGCYSQGELPSLLMSLEELSKSSGYDRTCYSQSLAVTLLSDYTFSQYPRTRDNVVAFVLNSKKFRLMVATGQYAGPGALLYLPKENGNQELTNKCFEELSKDPKLDYGRMLVDTLNSNSELTEISPIWKDMQDGLKGSKLTRWISYGLRLGIVQNIDNSELNRLIDEPSEYKKRLYLFAFRGLWKYILLEEQRVTTVVDVLLDRDNDFRRYRQTNIIHALAEALSCHNYMLAHRVRSSNTFVNFLERYGLYTSNIDDDEQTCRQYEILDKCHSFILMRRELLKETSGNAWATTIQPWTNLCEKGRELFGERWAFCLLANASAGIRSSEEKCDDANALFNNDVPITRRARHARLKAGNWRWWQKHLAEAVELTPSP